LSLNPSESTDGTLSLTYFVIALLAGLYIGLIFHSTSI